MENREFIAAKDLPVTEAKEVDVLCVDPETGELSKKSGANLGGGSSVDVVIHYTCNFAASTTSTPIETVELTFGDYNAIKNKLASLHMINGTVVTREIGRDGTETSYGISSIMSASCGSTDECIYLNTADGWFCLYNDGTVEP